MTISLEQIISSTRILTTLALILQTIEAIRLKAIYSNDGAWSWQLLKNDWSRWPMPFQKIMTFIMSPHVFLPLLYLQITIALAIGANLVEHRYFYIYLLVLNILTSIRFRGNFNGGSDSMTAILLLSLTLIAWFPHHNTLSNSVIFYIGIQSTLSYFIAGLVKIKNPHWRNGRALSLYLRSSMYDTPQMIKALAKNQRLMAIASWAVLIFELSFIGCFWFRSYTIVWLLVGLCFHLTNFMIMGLNRFFWAWLATYPAIFWLMTQR